MRAVFRHAESPSQDQRGAEMTKVQRYKVGFFQDEWGMSSITPCLIPDDSGFAVKFEDYCKLEAEIERLRDAVRQQESQVWKEQRTSLELQDQLAKAEQRVAEHGRSLRNDAQ